MKGRGRDWPVHSACAEAAGIVLVEMWMVTECQRRTLVATGGSRLSVVGDLGEWGRCAFAVGELASVGTRIGQGIFSILGMGSLLHAMSGKVAQIA